MAMRILLVIALAIVVGFGVTQLSGQGRNTATVAESGETLDAALSGTPDLSNGERWYDNPTTIGLMAGGIVFVIGVIVAVSVRPAGEQRGRR